MNIDAFVEGVRFNTVRSLAIEMMAYRTDAAYHIIELGVRLKYIDIGDAKDIREYLDYMQEQHTGHTGGN